jgi:hypothetical protein
MSQEAGQAAGVDVGIGRGQDASALVAQLQRDNQFLQERLIAAEEERSELRRMLLFEQQTVASLRQMLPAPQEANGQEPSEGARPSRAAQQPPPTGDDAQGMHSLAHQLERKKPWWWLPGWRKQRGR